MKEKYYGVSAWYSANSFCKQSSNFEYDKAIQRLAPLKVCAKCITFNAIGCKGYRDINFYNLSKEGAHALAAKCRQVKVRGLGRVRAEVYNEAIDEAKD